MKLVGICHICSHPSMYTCSSCGRPACGLCYDKELRVCIACKTQVGPKIPKRLGEENPEDNIIG
jgi:hypothetical protein